MTFTLPDDVGTDAAPAADYLSALEASRLADTSPEHPPLGQGRLPVAIETRAGRLLRRADVLAARRSR